MIGLDRPANAGLGDPSEPAQIRTKTKKQLYDQLAEELLLPSLNSKGLNRKYLVAVYKKDVYTLNRLDYRRFEAELSPNQLKKNNLTNLAYILKKLNAILREKGEKTLGFPDHWVPEEEWLVKVARYVDRKNVMEFFKLSLPTREPNVSDTDKLHQARANAHVYLFGGNNLMSNNKVYMGLKEISELYRKVINKKIDIEALEASRTTMYSKLAEEEALLKSCIMRTATTVVATAESTFDPDEIYVDDNETSARHRHQLCDVAKL